MEGECSIGRFGFGPQGRRAHGQDRARQRLLLVRALGELDIATADALDEELRRVWYCDASPMILDLGKVDFIDSMGLRTLLAVAKHSRENGDRLRIRPPPAAVRRVIEVS